MTVDVDCVVIGAGVVGLAIARALQQSGRDVILLEKECSFGTETSSRNSEVIHAGIYYPPGSLKAELCVRGRHLLYAYCGARGVPHARLGKIIVATTATEVPTLVRYLETARTNGADDLEWLDTTRLQAFEPAVHAVCGLLSPSTGIIDSHAYMQALSDDFTMAGGEFIRASPVSSGRVLRGQIELHLADDEATVIKARAVVNSGGLYAPNIAAAIEGFPKEHVPCPRYAIGHYYVLAGRSPFRHLVYPVAGKGGLGVHVTLDLSGAARFGPDVRWRDGIDYEFDDSQREAFVEAIRTYYPGMEAKDLRPGYTGIRPKISGPEEPSHDFCIQNGADYGAEGLINLFGIESPGLTASLAIAERVCALIQDG